jgi:hypothetical protein
MSPELNARRCVNHPDRPGLATCKQCRSTICQECATQWDGINYCGRCVADLRKSLDRKGAGLGWLGLGIALPVLFLATAKLMIWALVLLREMVD